MEIKYKQYIIITREPEMSKGKICSQVCHASFMALEKQRFIEDIKQTHKGLSFDKKSTHIIEDWKKSGMCVIVLEARDTEHLSNIAKYLEQWEVLHHLYIDEGITEVDPMTPTALATGVLPEDKHWMFEQFKLFGEDLSAETLVGDRLCDNCGSHRRCIDSPYCPECYRKIELPDEMFP